MEISEVNKVEKALLGLVIKKPSLSSNVIGILKEEYFSPENKEIYGIISNLFNEGKKIDETILFENLKNSNLKSDKFWIEYLSNLILDAGIESHLNDYIDLILERNHKKLLEESLESSLSLIKNNNKALPFKNLIQVIEDKIFKITSERELKDFEPISILTNDFKLKLDLIEKEGYREGILTNLEQIDDLLGGFKKGEFIVIAARPSMGKTAFALQIISNISLEKNVGFFSLEMPSDAIMQRFISVDSMISQNFVREYDKLNQRDREKISSSLHRLHNKRIWVDDTPGLTIGELVWKIRKLHSIVNLNVVFIDYLQLIENEMLNENRQQSVSKISRTLKSLARELNLPIIALSQLSRKVESREDKRPMMSDLRESGAIEQDADVILLLYRANYYNKENKNLPVEGLEVIISKNRNGKTGIANLNMTMEFGKITSKMLREY